MPNPKPTQLQGITDLTVFADIRPGLIEGIFDSRSYAWRLARVLDLLDAARRINREADVMPSPFIDAVARLRGVHFFRFAIVPGNKLLLSVTFDGGWEPYIRLIWGQLGTMLDLIFCHSPGYPLAAASSHEDYLRWVRDHEVPSQFFYADSGGTVADRMYLNRLEAQQRLAGERPGADLRASQLALESPQSPQPTQAAVLGALRSLKGLFGLVPFFGMPSAASEAVPVPADDGSVLLRFAQDFLSDLRGWYAQGLFDPGRQFDTLRQPFERERMWLMSKQWTRPNKRDRLTLTKSALQTLQAGIFGSPRAAAAFGRGALVLARVIDPRKAREWLKASSSSGLISNGESSLADDSVLCTVAITYPGLQELGVPERHLASLPAEFVQGMEARAGLLGDVRINHPQQWNRPRAARGPGSPIDLSLVHLVIQLRTGEANGEKPDDRSLLLPRLERWINERLVIEKLASAAIEVLAVEPAWSKPAAAGEAAPRDHFGFVDGVSKPAFRFVDEEPAFRFVDGVSKPDLPPSAGTFWDDFVKTGELLLGWVNDRGDGPLATPGGPVATSPEWLDNGTFLVVRKIRQFVERFDDVVERAAGALAAAGSAPSIDEARELVRAKLVGRRSDGTPLVAQGNGGLNDFDFRSDGDGAQCPFASHVRRANPRPPLSGMRPPRIVRRGMSYSRGANERGVLFMAYNASIAEQFEVIQRWLTGGNSSGVSSSQSDPLLGVPRVGEPGVFRFTHGDQVVRVDLGDQPICKLEWGLYAFVPPLTRLEDLDGPPAVGAPRSNEPSRAPETPEEREKRLKRQVKAEFEDDVSRGARWRRLRDKHSGVEKIGSTVVVGGLDLVTKVLADSGSTYSASGYGKRMTETLGPSPFGEDDGKPDTGHGRPFVAAVKKAIGDAVTEADAYKTAFQFVAGFLTAQLANSRAVGLPAASVDVVDVGIALIAELCQKWFGVVYGDGRAERGSMGPTARPVRCPGHFLSMGRNIFSAYPNETVQGLAGQQGPALKEEVVKWVADARKSPSAPVLQAVLDAIDVAPSAKGMGEEEKNGTVANVMLGLPPTLLGSWGKVLRAWIADRRLWRLQYDLSLLPRQPVDPDHPDAVRMDYAYARDALRNVLILTMAADPVADGIWRTAQQSDKLSDEIEVEPNDVVWLGLGSALAGLPGDLDRAEYLKKAEDVLFGHVEGGAPHACPGRGLAIGAMLGGLAALLLAGQWAPTPGPTTVILKTPPV